MKRDPIIITCEGSEGTGNRSVTGLYLGCQMCGRWFHGAAQIPMHDRNDILAMIDRGDFN